MPKKTSAEYVSELRANVDRYFAGTLTREEFDREQRRLWDEIGNGRKGDKVAQAVCPMR